MASLEESIDQSAPINHLRRTQIIISFHFLSIDNLKKIILLKKALIALRLDLLLIR